jgi:Putative hydroxyindole-O-methyltransferase.
VEQAKILLKDYPNMREFYAEGLQSFDFKHKYDCIWVQWVSSHLTDDDFVVFLNKCADALTETVISKLSRVYNE